MKLRVKIKKLHEDAVIPQYAKEGDSGFDLVAAQTVFVEPGKTTIVPTGLAFEIPPGYELQVRPRSGVSRKTKLRVVLGTVDSGYRGEVGVIVDNIKNDLFGHIHDTEDDENVIKIEQTNILYDIEDMAVFTSGEAQAGTYIIHKGDRIAQGVIAPVETAQFYEVDELSDSERGNGGFGSTGTK